MTSIALATFGTRGDIQPMLALGRLLRSRGFGVVAMVNPVIAPLAERAGLDVCPVGEPMDASEAIARDPRLMGLAGGKLVLQHYFIPAAERCWHATHRLLDEGRVQGVVAHVGCFGCRWAAEQRGVPSVSVHLAPMSLASPSSFNYMPAGKRLLLKTMLPLFARAGDRWMAPVRRKLGLPAGRGDFLEAMTGGELILALWSPRFRPAAAEDAPGVRLCGFPASPTDEPLDATVQSFLDAGDPPIVFTLGSSAVNVAGRFYDHAVAACRRLGRRGLLLTGPAGVTASHPDVLAVPAAPHPAVFARAAAVVHHCGIGTTAAALQAGTPVLAVPFAHDQFDNAERLVHLGVARQVPRWGLNDRRLERGLRQVLAPATAHRATDLARQLAEEPDGLAVAAEHIDRHVRQPA